MREDLRAVGQAAGQVNDQASDPGDPKGKTKEYDNSTSVRLFIH